MSLSLAMGRAAAAAPALARPGAPAARAPLARGGEAAGAVPGGSAGSFRARLVEQTAASGLSQGRGDRDGQAVHTPANEAVGERLSNPAKPPSPAAKRARTDEGSGESKKEDRTPRPPDGANPDGATPDPGKVVARSPKSLERQAATPPGDEARADAGQPAQGAPETRETTSTVAAESAVDGAKAAGGAGFGGRYAVLHGSLQFAATQAASRGSLAGSGAEPGQPVVGAFGRASNGFHEVPTTAAEKLANSGATGKSNVASVPRETILPTGIAVYTSDGLYLEGPASVLPDTHASVENPGTGRGHAYQELTPSFDEGKTIGSDLGSESVFDNPQKFPQPLTTQEALSSKSGEGLNANRAGALEPSGRTQASQLAETNVGGRRLSPAGARLDATSQPQRTPDDQEKRPKTTRESSATPALEGPGRPEGSFPSTTSIPTGYPGVEGGPGEAFGGEYLSRAMTSPALPKVVSEPTADPDAPAAAGISRPGTLGRQIGGHDAAGQHQVELREAAFGLRMEATETAHRASPATNERQANLNGSYTKIYSSFEQEPFPRAAKSQPSVDGGSPSRATPTAGPGRGGAGSGQQVATVVRAWATTITATVESGMDYQYPGDGGGDSAATGNPGGTSPVAQDPSRVTDSSLNGSRSKPAMDPQAADNFPEAAGRFVRGASIEASGSDVQRISVLMQDDRLGRIALRMVDRAGLLHAVVRTDGTRAAEVLTESLPLLLESLSQRGLPASWTSAHGEGQSQHSDARQGQPRRQRGGQGSSPGGRRPARSPDPVFQVEAR